MPAFGTTQSIVPKVSIAFFATARETSGIDESPATYAALSAPSEATIS